MQEEVENRTVNLAISTTKQNVVAFTDKEAVTLVPVEDQKISKDGVRIYDIYHTYH